MKFCIMNRALNICFCTCCANEIFPFDHYEDDEGHLNALSDCWALSFDFVKNGLSDKIFISFDSNEDAISPLKEVDPCMNFYKGMQDTNLNTCDYYFKDSFNKKFCDLDIGDSRCFILI